MSIESYLGCTRIGETQDLELGRLDLSDVEMVVP